MPFYQTQHSFPTPSLPLSRQRPIEGLCTVSLPGPALFIQPPYDDVPLSCGGTVALLPVAERQFNEAFDHLFCG